MFCSLKAQKWTAFGSFGFLLGSGLFLVLFWSNIFNSYLRQQVVLSPDTYQYEYWLETPFDLGAEMYLFTWTNQDEFGNASFKPRFEQRGPYVFAERHKRSNVIFNDNKTVSFNTIKRWHFKHELSNGTMDDMITVMNPIVMSMANAVKYEHPLIKRAINYFLAYYNKTLYQTNTVQEFLFDGIDDPLIYLGTKLKMKKFTIPFDKFGYFYSRNDSESYDGNYTMWTGEDDLQKTGIVTDWDFMNHSTSYDGECSRIDGTTGEVWYPVKKSSSVSMFIPDVCSLLTLEQDGSRVSNGIEGNLYRATDRLLDNGTKYPETECFGTLIPTGVRNISACHFGSPAFLSLPHFQMADSSYIDAIDGMDPDPEKHKIEMVIQPEYGFPLEAYIAFQTNFQLQQIKEIDLLKNAKDTMIPYLWLKMAIVIPDHFGSMIKLALAAPNIGQWVGYTLIFISLILFVIGVYLELKMRQLEKRDIS